MEDGHDDHAARALVNFATASVTRRRGDPRIPEHVERALRFVRERELDGYVQYLLGVRANLRLCAATGREAEADAHASLAFGEDTGVSLCPALIVLGRLQARRGDPGAGDDARRTPGGGRSRPASCSGSGRPRRRGPSTPGSRAISTAVAEVARPAYELAAGARRRVGARASSRTGCGGRASPVAPRPTTPSRTRARWPATGRARPRRGSGSASPTSSAEALSDADDEAARLEALARYEALGARARRRTCGGGCAPPASSASRAARAPRHARARPG